MGVTRKNIRCCRPFPDSLLKQPNLMNSCRRERERERKQQSLSSSEPNYRERRSSGVERYTHPTGDQKIVDADQILLQLQKLLEVLHLDQAALQLLHHLGHLGQSSCREG